MIQNLSQKPVRQRVTRTRAALTEALLALLEERSQEHITIRDITTRAQVGYATFFRNYPDKEALLHDLAADEINRLLTMTLPLFFGVDSESSCRALCGHPRNMSDAMLAALRNFPVKGPLWKLMKRLGRTRQRPMSTGDGK